MKSTTCLVQIRVCERDMVIARNAVAESRETLVDPLDDHLVRQAVLQVLELCGHNSIAMSCLSLAAYEN